LKQALKLPLFIVPGSDLVTEKGKKQIHGLFEKAKAKTPCIVLIEDIEGIVTTKGGDDSVEGEGGTCRRFLQFLLFRISCLQIFVSSYLLFLSAPLPMTFSPPINPFPVYTTSLQSHFVSEPS
jgi:ATPase family associated with various cellular activities (AAA)